MTDSPNILFLMPDQHRGDCLSLERHPAILTPNIDAIGGSGTHFRRAYTTCPSCIPARRSLLTGQFPSTHGMVGMSGGYALSAPTLPGELRAAGYQTILIGRDMHQTPASARYGYDHMVLGSTYVLNDDYATDLLNANGERGTRGAGISENGWTARPWHLAESQHPTNWIVRQSRRFLETHDEMAPFFLTVSFYSPHPPLLPPAFYMERYLRMDLPPVAIGDWETPPENDGLGLAIDSPRVRLSGEALRSSQAGYYGLINHIDDQLHWLIADFKAASKQQGREWLIVYTSDHGEMMGDHYLFRKCEPYEGSARIPLLICASPGLGLNKGQACSSPVCLEDLMPTLLELAGRKIPSGVDGRSLVPILRGQSPGVREVLHGEHASTYGPQQANHYLTDGRHKYIWRPASGHEQLFNLDEDPRELHDLVQIPDASQLVTIWRKRLIDRLKDRPEAFTDGHRLIPGRPYPRVMPHLKPYQPRA